MRLVWRDRSWTGYLLVALLVGGGAVAGRPHGAGEGGDPSLTHRPGATSQHWLVALGTAVGADGLRRRDPRSRVACRADTILGRPPHPTPTPTPSKKPAPTSTVSVPMSDTEPSAAGSERKTRPERFVPRRHRPAGAAGRRRRRRHDGAAEDGVRGRLVRVRRPAGRPGRHHRAGRPRGHQGRRVWARWPRCAGSTRATEISVTAVDGETRRYRVHRRRRSSARRGSRWTRSSPATATGDAWW